MDARYLIKESELDMFDEMTIGLAIWTNRFEDILRLDLVHFPEWFYTQRLLNRTQRAIVDAGGADLSSDAEVCLNIGENIWFSCVCVCVFVYMNK